MCSGIVHHSLPLKTVGSLLAHHCYKSLERAGQRQNYFRQASTSDFVRWFGSKFRYSSDYICSHTSEFSTSVSLLARLGNRSEEFGEVLFRAAGCASRLVGGAVPGTLRQLTGKGRFVKRLKKKLGANPPITDEQMGQLFDYMVERKAFSAFGTSKHDLTKACFDKLLSRIDGKETPPDWLAGLVPNARENLRAAVVKADLRRLVAHRSFATKVAMAVGCAAIALAYFVVYTAAKTVEMSLASTFFIKFGMLSAVAYTLGFIFRSAATILARVTQAHNRTYTAPENKKEYFSIYDKAAKSLRAFRNNNPVTGNTLETSAAAYKQKDNQHELSSMAVLADDERAWVRYPARVSRGLDVATDVMFSLDRVIGQGCSRLLQHSLFRYEEDVRHEVGISANGKCNYNWKFKKGDAFRRGLASFIGRGGADCLGMAIGCASCSTAWSALNLAVPAGVMFPVAAIGGVSGGLALGFASVAAIGWGSAAVVDAGVQLGTKVAQLAGSQKNLETTALIDPQSNTQSV